jgi:hypothetical protein
MDEGMETPASQYDGPAQGKRPGWASGFEWAGAQKRQGRGPSPKGGPRLVSWVGFSAGRLATPTWGCGNQAWIGWMT